MLLVVKNQTFPPFGVTIKIVSLIDKMVDNTTHGLSFKSCFSQFEVLHDLTFYHHSPQKNVRGETTYSEGSTSFDLGWIESSIPLMLFLMSTSKSIKVHMFSKVDDPFGVEIEPTYGLESSSKFPNFNWTSP